MVVGGGKGRPVVRRRAPAWVVGPSHVVPGQEAGSQGHAGGQDELEAGLAQYS